ncbi:MAG: hypothetical protein V7K18_21935 [Nostoc sp.]|uniref:hypothetical protein n=1 Tax=Nostoc sp. TaxID=1180 RepID=UPI002FF5EBC3
MSEPRYGIWIPVYGNCGVMNHPLEPRDASYSLAKNLIQLAQRRGFTTTLIAQHIINSSNQELNQLETWTAAGLVGSYEIVAHRIAEFTKVGIDTFMLQFQPFAAEMERFAAEIIPRVRALTVDSEAMSATGYAYTNLKIGAKG